MLKLGVFFGSRSVEHEISIITALQAIAQLKSDPMIEIVPVYMSKTGDWYTGDVLLELDNYKDIPKLLTKAHKINLVRENDTVQMIPSPVPVIGAHRLGSIDVAFPILHGSFGEDGTLQGFFEHMQLPYAGCRTMAAATTMDKIMTKLVLRSVGVKVIDDVWFNAEDFLEDPEAWVDNIEKTLGYPVIVKPSDTGSSVGVTPAKDRPALLEALHSVRHFSNRILVERMVQNMREINISVLGDATGFDLSVCEEPLSSSEFLTFEDKYTQGGKGAQTKGMSSAKRRIPADLDQTTKRTIESYAAHAFHALDCSGVCRIDFIIDKTTNTVYLNEFNTIPGSLSFYLWEATGVKFDELLKRLIKLGVRKFERDRRIVKTHDTNILSGVSLGGIKK